MSKQANLGTDAIRPLFFMYYFPALVSILSVTAHQLINGIILGQKVGKEGLAAVGLYGPVLLVFIAFALPVMIGGGIIIAKSIGEKNYDKPQQVFSFATTLATVLGGIVAITTPFYIQPLAKYLAGAESATLLYNTAGYLFWQLLSLPVFFIRMFWGNYLSNDSSQKISRNASVLAVIVNIVLDVIFIVGLDMGVEGASVATAFAILGATVYQFIHINKGNNHFSFKRFSFTLRFPYIKDLLQYGLPSFVSEIAFATGLLLVNQSVQVYGASAVAAFGLVNYISFIFIRLFTSAMIASLPIISYNIGAKLPHRVVGVVKFAVLFTLTIGVIVSALGFLIPDLLVILFSGETTAEFRQLAGNAIGLYFLLFLAAGPNYILGAYLQSIGKTTLSVIINLLKGFALIVLLLAILPTYCNLGLNGVWLSRSLAEVVTLLLIGGYVLLNKDTYFSNHAILKKE